MWIFLNDSFLSIVDDRQRPGHLLVRARIDGDIERAFEGYTVPLITHTPSADYPYRASVPHDRVADVIASHISTVNYPNFKASVKERDRHDAYMGVWGEMRRFQLDREFPLRTSTRYGFGSEIGRLTAAGLEEYYERDRVGEFDDDHEAAR